MNHLKSIIVAVLVLLSMVDGFAANVGAEAARASALSFIRSQASGKLMAQGVSDLRLVYT